MDKQIVGWCDRALAQSGWRWLAAIVAAVAASGCPVDARETDGFEGDAAVPTSETLSEEVFASALNEQNALEEQAFALIGRVWLKRDSYVAYFVGPDGTELGTQLTGRETLLSGEDMPRPLEGESLHDFSERVRNDAPIQLSDSPEDTLLFAPEPAGDAVAEVVAASAALSDLEQVALILQQCDQTARNQCGGQVGWVANNTTISTAVSWTKSQVSSDTRSGSGSAGFASFCAHGGGATVSMKGTDGWGQVIFDFTDDIPPLAKKDHWFHHGWQQSEGCKTWFAVVCADWYWKTSFNQLDAQFKAVGRNGFPVQTFCGKITKNSTTAGHDSTCAARGNCPVFVHP